MPLTASRGRPDARPPGRPGRPRGWGARLAGRAGWLLLALVSMIVTYAARVFAGR